MGNSFDWVNLVLRLVQVALIPSVVFMVNRYIALKKDINGLGTRLAVAEKEIQQKPGNKAIHELALTVEGVSGDIKEVRAELKAELKGVADSLHRVEEAISKHDDYLLRQKGSQ